MNYGSRLNYVRRLARLDSQAWRYLPYKAKMRLLGIDLSLVNVDHIALSHERSHMHSDSGGPDLKRLLDMLPIERSDAVIDMGCGKGGAMLTLAKYPFARIDGVEISESLTRIARRNIERLKIANAHIFCSDAADFSDLDRYTHVYMCNPFPEPVMRCVLSNINDSLLRRDRTLTLIYRNPIFNGLLLEYGFAKILHTEQLHPDYPAFGVYLADARTADSCVRGFTSFPFSGRGND